MNTVRHLFKSEFARRIRDHDAIADAQVRYGWPGDRIDQDTVWIGAPSGDLSVPTFKGGQLHYDDTFEVDVLITVANHGESEEDSEIRSARYIDAVLDAVSAAPNFSDYQGVYSVTLGSWDGPGSTMTDEAAFTLNVLTVQVGARYQP